MVGNTPRPGFARLNVADGSLDSGFQPPVVDGFVNYFASDGADVFIMGGFRNIGGNARFCVAKLNGVSGAYIPQWAPVLNNPSNQASGNCPGFQRIEANGEFVYLAPASNLITLTVGTNTRRLARVNATTGQIDGQWDPNPNSGVARMQAFNDALYVYGQFTAISGNSTQNVARFDSSGSADFGFVNRSNEFNSVSGFSYGNISAGPGGVFVTYTQTVSGSPSVFQKRVRRLSISNGSRRQ